MKNFITLLFTFCVLVVQAQNFTSGNIVVTRIGNGTNALSANTAAVDLVEFTPAAANPATKTVSLGSTTGNRLVVTGTTSQEGQLSLSTNGNYLNLIGYDAPALEVSTANLAVSAIAAGAAGTGYTIAPTVSFSGGGGGSGAAATANLTSGGVSSYTITSSGSGYTSAPTVSLTGGNGSGATTGAVSTVAYWLGISTNRVIARLDNTGAVDYSTKFPVSSGVIAKNVVSDDGERFWALTNNIAYLTRGQTTAGTAILGGTTPRTINIYKNQIYSYRGFNELYYLNTTPLPTTSSTATNVTTSNLTPVGCIGYVLFDVDPTVGFAGTGFDLLYLGNTNSGLEKWYFNGSVWVAANTSSSPADVNPTGSGISGITGTLIGGIPKLYVVTGNGTATNNQLLVITDNSSRTTTMVLNTNCTSTSLATAGANYAFRGVAFAPGSNVVLAAELTSVKATQKGNTNLISWSTASEKDNASFIVERSANGQDFAAIGTVKGSGTSASEKNYTFSDETPLSTSYYRVKSVDYTGGESISKVVSVQRGKTTSLKIYPSPVSEVLTVDMGSTENATFTVVDIAGRTLLRQSAANQINVSALPKGLYFLTVEADGIKTTQKFVKQ